MPENITVHEADQNATNKASGRSPIIHVPTSGSKAVNRLLDTVGIAYACEAVERVEGCTETVHGVGTPAEARRWTKKLSGGGFVSWGMGQRCWVEASLPKAANDGDNVEALPLAEGLDVMRELWAEALTVVPPAKDRGGDVFERSKVVRVDLVRDFDDVANLPGVLDSLAEQARPLRWKASRFSDAGRGGSATLSVGPRAWKATLYDKHAETGGAAPEGRLRFEARLHHDQLVSVGVQDQIGRPALRLGEEWLSVPDHVGNRREVLRADGSRGAERGRPTRQATFTVADLAESELLVLRRWVFDRVGFGKEIMSTDTLRMKVFRPVDPVTLRDCEGLSKQEQRELWAFLTVGEQLCGFGRSARTKYRKIADRLGVVVERDGQVADVLPVSTALDFETGRQTLIMAEAA